MKIYLLRHGEAVSEVVDPKKPLSEKGSEEAMEVANFLGNLGVKVGKVFHSDKLRAEETARFVWEKVGGELKMREGLRPEDDVEGFGGFLRRAAESGGEDLVAVGHLPFMGKLVNFLVDGDLSTDLVIFETATCVCLEWAGYGKWMIRFVIGPKYV